MYEKELKPSNSPLFFKTPDADKTENNSIVQCTLCPHMCRIKNGKFGFCLVRGNINGKPAIPYYGKLSAASVDPVEKKPLYHFYPGSKILSVGFFGCSMKCPFCQNFTISTNVNPDYKSYKPEDILSMVKSKGGIGLAYTYSEPLVHIEWVSETSKLLRKNGYKNVLVTNGLINGEPADTVLEYTDAANIDLKSFNSDFYRKELKGDLEAVKNFIKKASEKIHVEITTLVIPGKNDTKEEIMEISSFIASINKNIPYHLSCYYPAYKYSIPSTPASLVFNLAELAKEKLNFVYTGNTGTGDTDTLCPSCGETIVKRSGYSAQIINMNRGKCKKCGFSTGIYV